MAMAFSEPAAMSEGSSENGPEKSGSGRRARTITGEDLFVVVVVLHFFAVILALTLIAINFGFLWVSFTFVVVTIAWVAWTRKYIRDQEARKVSREVDEARRRAATFTDPR